jgi:2-polyprenyl-6-methoxyphenol hydroxylase-like FAD-dependent oxidoreductase
MSGHSGDARGSNLSDSTFERHRVSVIDAPVQVFDRLVGLEPPAHVPALFGTVAVLGGSVAGLLAARVLADHSRKVLVIEPDETSVAGRPRGGVPHDRQLHGLLQGGQALIERWLPGVTHETVEHGGLRVAPDRFTVHIDGEPQLRTGGAHILQCSRPLLEAGLRRRVLALPNVEVLRARVTGLAYQRDAVSSVHWMADGVERTVDTEFVVDAMGRASTLSGWVEEAGFDRPKLERMQTGVHYATAVFTRGSTPACPDPAITVAQYPLQPGPGGVVAGLVLPIEDQQWMVGVATMGDQPPITSVEGLLSVAARMPAHFAEASSGAVTRELVNFRQADSRRRGFTGLRRYPARLVSMGDAAASFNAVYSQGMSSAALHAACLSEYLVGKPDLHAPAGGFFALQEVVVDALWSVSAGGDAARIDAALGTAVAEEIRQQRWAMNQMTKAALTDGTIAEAVAAVASVLAHPLSLADPHLLERAITINQAAATAALTRG